MSLPDTERVSWSTTQFVIKVNLISKLKNLGFLFMDGCILVTYNLILVYVHPFSACGGDWVDKVNKEI